MLCRDSDRSRLRSSLVVVIAGCGTATRRPRVPRPRAWLRPSVAATPSSAPSASAAATPAGSPGTKFAGVNINILTFNGPQVAEPLQRRAPDWEQLTGGHVNVVAVGFQTIYDKALLDASTGTNSFDALRLQSAVDGRLRRAGLPARPDRSREERSAARVSRTSCPFFRDYNSVYNGKVYTIPLDGDFHMVYYRTDLLAKDGLKPPATWDDYLTIASQVPRPGPQRRRPARLRLVHRQEEGRPELLVDHLAGGRPAPGQGHQRGRVLRHDRHEPAVRQERGHDPRPPDLRQDGPVRPAGRAEHGRRWHRAACSRPGAAP